MFDFSLSRPKPRPTVRVVFDLETHLIAPLQQAPMVVALGFRVDGGKPHVVMANDDAFANVVQSLLGDPSVLLVGHNVRFDLAVLMSYFGESEETQQILLACHNDRVTCTLIREALWRVAHADPTKANLPMDLGTCCDLWNTKTRPNKADPWRRLWGTLAGLHASQLPADAAKYLHEDLAATDELYRAQETKAPWLRDQYRQTQASLALYGITCWGLKTDPVAADQLYTATAAELEDAAALCRNTLQTYTKTKTRSVKKVKESFTIEVTEPIVRPDGRRNKKAAEARMLDVCKARGLVVPRGDATEKMLDADENAAGNIVLNDEACERSGDPILIAYSKVSQATGLLAKAARLKHPVIQPSFNTLVNTGRTSCRQGDDPKPGEAPMSYGFQIQNPPRQPGVREVFVARPEHALVSIDYNMAELVTWAQSCIDLGLGSDLAAVLRDPNLCPHAEMGAAINGLTAAEVYALKKTDKARFKNVRQSGKMGMFGCPGGLGKKTMVEYAWAMFQAQITEAEAAQIIAAWKARWREAGPYLNLIAERVGRDGRGRLTHFLSERVRGGLGFCAGANTLFQGRAADMGKAALWALTCEMYGVPSSPIYGARALAWIHDEVILELPLEGLHERAKYAAELFVNAAKPWVPDVALRADPAAMLRWSKVAGDPVYNAAEELIPYEWSLK